MRAMRRGCHVWAVDGSAGRGTHTRVRAAREARWARRPMAKMGGMMAIRGPASAAWVADSVGAKRDGA